MVDTCQGPELFIVDLGAVTVDCVVGSTVWVFAVDVPVVIFEDDG